MIEGSSRWPTTNHVKWLGFALCVGAVVFRSPDLLSEPRMWAEEGIYFKQAYSMTFLRSMGYVFPGAGYYTLGTSLPTAVAAHFTPIEWAPWVTTYFGLFFQLLPFVLILWGKSAHIRTE